MKIALSFCIAALIAIAPAARAERCAGGVSGGMGPTGNECSDADWRADGATPAATPGPAVARSSAAAGSRLERKAAKPRIALAAVERPGAGKRGVPAGPSSAEAPRP